MRNILLLLTLLAGIFFSGCKKDKDPIAPGTPHCIRQTILNNKNNPEWNVESISEYRFDNQLVYAFNSRYWHPDQQGYISDANCQSYCMVGGISANMICHGKNFNTAVFIRKVWSR